MRCAICLAFNIWACIMGLVIKRGNRVGDEQGEEECYTETVVGRLEVLPPPNECHCCTRAEELTCIPRDTGMGHISMHMMCFSGLFVCLFDNVSSAPPSRERTIKQCFFCIIWGAVWTCTYICVCLYIWVCAWMYSNIQLRVNNRMCTVCSIAHWTGTMRNNTCKWHVVSFTVCNQDFTMWSIL